MADIDTTPHDTGIQSAKEAAPGGLLGGAAGIAASLLVPYIGRRFGVALDVGTVAGVLGSAGAYVGSLISSYILGRRR